MRAGCLALLALTGCGRLGFGSDPAGDAAPPDAPPTPAACVTGDPCNGIDDDCDAMLDEDGCPPQCVGIARDLHGYVLCGGALGTPEAQQVCSSVGGSLARVDDAAENAWLRARAGDLGLPSSFFWLGGRDDVVEGEWRWPDGGLFWQGNENGSGTGLFQAWIPGEPNDSGNKEDCVLLGTDATWRDYSCGDLNPFICELPEPGG